jgi:hypothetical protein
MYVKTFKEGATGFYPGILKFSQCVQHPFVLRSTPIYAQPPKWSFFKVSYQNFITISHLPQVFRMSFALNFAK